MIFLDFLFVMRGIDYTQNELFSYRTLESRIPSDHPLRKLRYLVDILLTTLDEEFDDLYSRRGRASIAARHGERSEGG